MGNLLIQILLGDPKKKLRSPKIRKRSSTIIEESRIPLVANWVLPSSLQAIFAITKAYHGRGIRPSSFTIQKAILMFYTQCQLYPVGLVSELPCVQSWALKAGYALRRLATLLLYWEVLLKVVAHVYTCVYMYIHMRYTYVFLASRCLLLSDSFRYPECDVL